MIFGGQFLSVSRLPLISEAIQFLSGIACCKIWMLCVGGNKATVHCVLLNWQTWVAFRNFKKPQNSPAGQIWNFANEICSGIYIISSLRGGPNFSEGVNILLENKFWGSVSKIWIQLFAVHLYHDRPIHNEVCFVGKLQSMVYTPSHTQSGSIHNLRVR